MICSNYLLTFVIFAVTSIGRWISRSASLSCCCPAVVPALAPCLWSFKKQMRIAKVMYSFEVLAYFRISHLVLVETWYPLKTFDTCSVKFLRLVDLRLEYVSNIEWAIFDRPVAKNLVTKSPASLQPIKMAHYSKCLL